MKKALSLVLVLLLAVSLVASGCANQAAPAGGGDAAQESDVIKLGVFEPLTGANAAGGALELEGIKLPTSCILKYLAKRLS